MQVLFLPLFFLVLAASPSTRVTKYPKQAAGINEADVDKTLRLPLKNDARTRRNVEKTGEFLYTNENSRLKKGEIHFHEGNKLKYIGLNVHEEEKQEKG